MTLVIVHPKPDFVTRMCKMSMIGGKSAVVQVIAVEQIWKSIFHCR
jgi:hypothetical protein